MTAVIYRQLDGTLGWLVVRELLVDAAKQTCRLQGTPAIAVIRRKRHLLAKWDFEDDYD